MVGARAKAALLLPALLVLAQFQLFASGNVEQAPAVAQDRAPVGDSAPSAATARVTVQYATGFTVRYFPNYTVVTVTRPWPGARTWYRYVLVERGAPVPVAASVAAAADTAPNELAQKGVSIRTELIRVPIRSVVTMSTTFLTPIQELGELATLRGHDQTRWIYSPLVRKLVSEGKVRDVGNGSTLNTELILALKPDAMFVNEYSGEGDSYATVRRANVPLVVLGDWDEETPLGSAEWIKFISLFYNREREANSIFNRIATEYQDLKARAAETRSRPTVFSNAPYQGQWTVPGGRSYAARLFSDAGAHYVWADNDSTGNLFLDFESVFNRAHNADFWLNPGTWSSLKDGLRIDPRFADFKAFRDDSVYNNNARENQFGGIDYYESGPSHPERVLADLIKIFHPEILKRHEFYYYQRLK